MNIKLFIKLFVVFLSFFLMCVMKMWFSMLLFIGGGFVLLFLTKKRVYCSIYCPLGNMQDLLHDKKPAGLSFNFGIAVKLLIGLVFFGYIIVSIILFHDNKEVLRVLMMRMMLFTMLSGLILQMFFGKRTFCKSLCPAGNLMSVILKMRRR